jgi:hypothetical protein
VWLGVGGVLGLCAVGVLVPRAGRLRGAVRGAGDGAQASNASPRTAPSTAWREIYLGGSPAAEIDLVHRFAEEIKHVQSEMKARAHEQRVRRAFHAKIHAGLTNAELHVRSDLPPDLRVGFFQPGTVYRATVRLSNASGMIQPDSKRDLRGIAVRVHVDDRTEQDFLMTNAAASHARDARQFMVAATAMAHASRARTLLALVQGLGFAETGRMLWAILQAARVVDSLATEQYSSRGPFTYGPYAVKFRLQPEAGARQGCLGARGRQGDDFLLEDLTARLSQGPVSWELQVQRYVDPQRTPLEDGTVAWEESDAPAETIGRLVIPAQDLTSADARASTEAVDRLEFNPWNACPEFRPLGSLNRARKLVYPESAGYRAGRAADGLIDESAFGRAYWALTESIYHAVNRFVPWHRLPGLLGALNLAVFRRELRRKNLHDTSRHDAGATAHVPAFERRFLVSRTSDGTYNDLDHPEMGSSGYRFGRNVPLADAFPEAESHLLDPNPREISERLLRRREFVPAGTLNLLAAAWIQFQVHDWFSHRLAAPGQEWRLPVPSGGDTWGDSEMPIRRTQADTTRTPEDSALPPTYVNENSHWWDGSQIYGSEQKITDRLRSHTDGKLIFDEATGCLPIDPATGIPVTGFTNNWWAGLTILHNLFAREHNAICDLLRREHRSWSDERIFDVARLINVALMAKIHTVEWTPGILAHPALQIGMNANWSGIQTAALQRVFGRLSSDEGISGIPGSSHNHDGVPFALTEEFVAVYRMHPLIPDEVAFHSLDNGRDPSTRAIDAIAFGKAQEVFADYSFADVVYSFGLANPGAIRLRNYPQFLRDLRLPPSAESPDGPRLDLAAIDILRDRERGVPRYNRFRELLHRGRVRTFEEITPNGEWANELREIYGDVDRVDLMVGMYAESPPQGFGFSDTAFRIFVLMASRRLKSDRFFTTDWRPEVYTPEGMEWISNNGMASVLLRHFPELAPALRGVKNPFAPWTRL